jgi:S-adenosylmethionine uptake transporter
MQFQTWHPLTAANLPWVLGLGVSAMVAQLAMTRAYKIGRKLLVANLSYLTVAFSALFGALLWQHWLGWQELAAMSLIILSGIVASRR